MKTLFYMVLCTACFSALAGLTACENTYKGIGHDIGNKEMQDGWD